MKEIGTVEILRYRVYPLDAASDDFHGRTEVSVAPGVYPLYVMGLSYFWMMEGNINTGRMFRVGDGIFTMRDHDTADGPKVTFPSRFFGPDEFKKLIKEAEALNITMDEPFPSYEND